MKKIAIIVLLIFGVQMTSYSQEQTKEDAYVLKGEKVTKHEFEKFRASLTTIENTYHCKKTINGGLTSYEAKDKEGKVYIVSSLLEEKIWDNRIFLKE